jgi:hypothetical protein
LNKQQEQAVSDAAQKKITLTPDQLAEQQRRQGLQLSRQRILQQLQLPCNPRHRQMLEKGWLIWTDSWRVQQM